jgi:hypothetical protein
LGATDSIFLGAALSVGSVVMRLNNQLYACGEIRRTGMRTEWPGRTL